MLRIKGQKLLYLTIFFCFLYIFIFIQSNRGQVDSDYYTFEDFKEHKNNPLNLKGSLSLSPFIIDDTGGGDYTWSEAVAETWCSGSGNWNDPYIIENITINGGGVSGSCLLIKNSREYFRIQNCTFINSGSDLYDAGIELENTTCGVLINNNFTDNRENGILLYNAHNNTISGNIASNIQTNYQINGIYNYNSSNNLFSENIAYNNVYCGIYLENATDNFIMSNTFNKNAINGIYIEQSSNNNTIWNNTINENLKNGIKIAKSESNNVSNNIIKENSDFGIYLNYLCQFNSIEENIISNIFKNSQDGGIYLSKQCYQNRIMRNMINNNSDFGIKTFYCCNYNIIKNNSVNDNGQNGIYIYDRCYYNNITGNYIYNNFSNNQNNGILLESVSFNSIIANTIYNNYQAGISVEYCHSNLIVYNNISNNRLYNIKFEESENNNIFNNLLDDVYKITCISIDDNGAEGINWVKLKEYNLCSGSGTWDDPYLIEELVFNGNSGFIEFNIINNYHYLIVQNCIITNSLHSDFIAGIQLENVSNGIIKNNYIFNNFGDGIRLKNNCRNITICNNYVNDNGWVGITMWTSCNKNTISNNTLNWNDYGISLSINCNNNTIYNNTVENNFYDGITLNNDCNENIIRKNTGRNTGYIYQDVGIFIIDSRENLILENTMDNHDEYGIQLVNGDNNYIYFNNLTDNDYGGIFLYDRSDYNHISNNIAKNQRFNTQTQGIYVYQSWYNNISMNSFINNSIRGFSIFESQRNIIYHNNLSNNSSPYIILSSENNNIFLNNYNGIDISTSLSIGETGSLTWAQAANINLYTGSGTSVDPYVIQNMEFDSLGVSTGIQILNTQNVIVQNCTVFNTGNISYDGGIKFDNVNNGTIAYNNCSNNMCSGIILYNTVNTTVIGNIVNNNNEYGITLQGGSQENNITGNTGSNNNIYGIYLRLSNYNTISNNRFNNEINLVGSNYCQIINNSITNSPKHGIYLVSDYSNITDNVIYNCLQDGIYLDGSDYAQVLNNTIFDNSKGIFLEGCIYTTVANNSLTQNDYGIYMWDTDWNNITLNLIETSLITGIRLSMGCSYNFFFNNSLINNLLQAQDTGTNNYWNNSMIGNYWDNYFGYDENYDGIGEMPYISGAVIDYLPICFRRVESSIFDGLYIDHMLTDAIQTPAQFSYIYLGGNIFNETWTGNMSTWQVDNKTRVMSGGSYFGDGDHTPAWIYRNVKLSETIPIATILEGDHNFTVVGETTHSFPGYGDLDIWILQDNTYPDAIVWYEKNSGILLNGTFVHLGGTNEYTFDFVLSNGTLGINDYVPELLMPSVSPTDGSQITIFNFSVVYQDKDNNSPIYVKVLINGTSYAMEKEDLFDNNYNDGCTFQYFTKLLPGWYNYSFECKDARFFNWTTTYTNLQVIYVNDYAPNLTNGQVIPNVESNETTLFNFTVFYFDDDNNLPAQINITINNTGIYNMLPINPLDTNAIDGILYYFNTTLDFGYYQFQINCSDGSFLNSTGWIIGPEVNPFYGADIVTLLTPTNMSSFFTGIYNFTWTSLEFIYGVVNYTLQISNVSDFSSIILQKDEIKELSGKSNLTQGIFFDSGLYYWRVRPTYDIFYGNWSNYLMFNLTYNENIPSLISRDVNPFSGDQWTQFNITVNYFDADNNHPYFINVSINGTSFTMTKQNPSDNNYTDGSLYQYITRLVPNTYNYSYSFECGDGKYLNSTILYSDLEVIESNFNAPSLINGQVSPTIGINSTLFNFTVNYFDDDNNLPIYVNITFNNTLSFSMVQANPSDINATNGIFFYYNTTLDFGYYQFQINYSDGSFLNSTGWINGPEVNPFYGAGIVTLLTPTNTSSFFTGIYNFTWTSLGLPYGAVNYTLQVSSVSDFSTIIFDKEEIREVVGISNLTQGIYNDSDIYYWRARPTYGPFKGNWSNYFIYNLTYNENIPNLISGEVDPISGDQWTLFNFSVNYIDVDNNYPYFINVTINGTSFKMIKQNPFDNDYTDGCAYKYSTPLLPNTYNYSYSFECGEGKYLNSTILYLNIEVIESNFNTPSLINGKVYPTIGVNSTSFNFTVNYIDDDNNLPSQINVTINNTGIFSMIKAYPIDNNAIDGILYYYNTTLDWGYYQFQFFCSDFSFSNSTGWIIGPEVNPFYGGSDDIIIFYDDFERVSLGSDWTHIGGGTYGINADTSQSGINSAYHCHSDGELHLKIIDLSSYNSVNVSYWIQQGDNSIGSENPDGGEDLYVEYYNNLGIWSELDQFLGADLGATIYIRSHLLPVDALHSGFRLRFRQQAGTGSDYDYWHIDDVKIEAVGTSKVTLFSPSTDIILSSGPHSFLWENLKAFFSPVTYTLQISRNADFSTIYYEINDIVETPDTTSVSINIEGTESEGILVSTVFSNGQYYWRVRPTYGPFKGNWSEISSFSVSILPKKGDIGELEQVKVNLYIIIILGVIAGVTVLALFSMYKHKKKVFLNINKKNDDKIDSAENGYLETDYAELNLSNREWVIEDNEIMTEEYKVEQQIKIIRTKCPVCGTKLKKNSNSCKKCTTRFY